MSRRCRHRGTTLHLSPRRDDATWYMNVVVVACLRAAIVATEGRRYVVML